MEPGTSVVTMKRGDRISMELPGGGGFGDPFMRDPEAVLADVRLGFVSAEQARDAYGVELTPDGTAVDSIATTTHRTGLAGGEA
jgi:N-methylhydantoinase B